jgi:hypothetical protein
MSASAATAVVIGHIADRTSSGPAASCFPTIRHS